MIAKATYSPLAREDIDSLAAHIAEDNPRAARGFQRAVRDSINLLLRFPELAAVYPHPNHQRLRAKLVNGFHRYVIFYTVESYGIHLVRLLHTSRDIPSELNEESAG